MSWLSKRPPVRSRWLNLLMNVFNLFAEDDEVQIFIKKEGSKKGVQIGRVHVLSTPVMNKYDLTFERYLQNLTSPYLLN